VSAAAANWSILVGGGGKARRGALQAVEFSNLSNFACFLQKIFENKLML